MQKLTKEYIDNHYRPYTYDEAKTKIGKYIIKRSGVYSDDNGAIYKIADVINNRFQLFEEDCFYASYRFESIIYDYVFENGDIIGATK